MRYKILVVNIIKISFKFIYKNKENKKLMILIHTMGFLVRMEMPKHLWRGICMGSSLVATPYTIKNVIKFHYHKIFKRMDQYLIK